MSTRPQPPGQKIFRVGTALRRRINGGGLPQNKHIFLVANGFITKSYPSNEQFGNQSLEAFMPKQSSDKLSRLAAKVLRGYWPTKAEVKRLAASVLSQDETKGKRK